MSEKLRLTCVCGYENWIRPDQLGQTIECTMCGADLVADEAALAGHLETPDTETPDDEPAPESPTNPPHAPAEIEEGPTLEERVEQTRKKRNKPLSPFDAEEDELEPPPASPKAEAPAIPEGASRPRPRSPFEADEPEEEQPRGAGPFTMEAGSRSEGGTAYADLMEGSRPKDRHDRHVVVQTISPHDAPSGETCVECGREIRGSWDRVETEKGVVCYVCSNQAVQGVPDRLKSEPSQKRELNETDLLVEPEIPETEESIPWYKDTESPEFKRVIFFLALFTVLLAAYFMFFDNSPAPTEQTAVVEPTEPEVEITPFTGALFQGWQILSFFMSFFLGVYISLKMDDATPHGKLLPDVLYIGAVTIPITVLYFFSDAVRVFIGQIPMAGGIFYVLIWIARWWIIYVILSRLIYMRLPQVLIAVVLYFVFHSFFFRALGVLIFRAMGIL